MENYEKMSVNVIYVPAHTHILTERRRKLGGGCNRNIIWQFGRFPDSAR
jgi:hypothetical protein